MPLKLNEPAIKFDVAVIGAGMAGATAALTAADNGKKVAIIDKGAGATSMSGGTVDICAGPTAGPRFKWDKLMDVKSNISETIIRYPHHPYSVLSRRSAENPADTAMGMIEEAVSFLRSRLNDAGLILTGDVFEQAPVPTSLGTWKLTSLVQSCLQKNAPPTGSAVLGIKNLSFPDSGFLAGMLEMTLEAKGLGKGDMIDSIEMEFFGERIWTVPELFEHLSRPGNWEKFTEAIDETAGERYSTLLVPPIVPYDAAFSTDLTSPGGAVLREIAGLPVNGAGLRLKKALDKSLNKAGVIQIEGQLLRFEGGKAELEKSTVSVNGKEIALEADSWVLSSGKFIGGGLQKGEEFKESLLGLPVFYEGVPLKKIWTKKLLGRSVLDRHDVFSVGLLTDSALRPLDADGRVIYRNLFAAGAVLGGYNYHSDGCGLGVCILTGRVAGKETSA